MSPRGRTEHLCAGSPTVGTLVLPLCGLLQRAFCVPASPNMLGTCTSKRTPVRAARSARVCIMQGEAPHRPPDAHTHARATNQPPSRGHTNTLSDNATACDIGAPPDAQLARTPRPPHPTRTHSRHTTRTRSRTPHTRTQRRMRHPIVLDQRKPKQILPGQAIADLLILLYNKDCFRTTPQLPGAVTLLELLKNEECHIFLDKEATMQAMQAHKLFNVHVPGQCGCRYPRLYLRYEKQQPKVNEDEFLKQLVADEEAMPIQGVLHRKFNLASLIAQATKEYASWDMQHVYDATVIGWNDSQKEAAKDALRDYKTTRATQPWRKTRANACARANAEMVEDIATKRYVARRAPKK